MQAELLDSVVSSNSQELFDASASSALKLFQNPQFRVRVIMRLGDPWFVAKDACDCLDLGNVSQTCSRLDEDERGITSNDTPSGKQEMLIISEPGLYSLIGSSKKPEELIMQAEMLDSTVSSNSQELFDLNAVHNGESCIASLDPKDTRENRFWFTVAMLVAIYNESDQTIRNNIESLYQDGELGDCKIFQRRINIEDSCGLPEISVRRISTRY